MTRFFILITALVLFASCRSTKQIQTAISKKDTAAAVAIDRRREDTLRFIRNTLYKIDSSRIAYNTFTGKVNVDYRGGDGKHYDLNVTVRMFRDSAIWLSANVILGIEGLRVLVTRDSIKLLNKGDKVYTARSIDYLQDVTSLPLDLHTLQDLIIGNAVFVDSNVVSFNSRGGTLNLLSIGQWFKHLLTLDANSGQLLHSKLDDVDIARNRTADLTYADYENRKGFPFATKRRITVTEKARLDIQLDFKQYELNAPVSFPFSVPKNYQRN